METQKIKPNRHDWLKLKEDFFSEEQSVSLRTFAEKRNLHFGGNFKRQTESWAKEKLRRKIEEVKRLNEEVQTRKIEELISIAIKHTKLYHSYLKLAEQTVEKALTNENIAEGIKNAENATRLLHNGQCTLLSYLAAGQTGGK